MSMFFNNAQWYMLIFRQVALKGGCHVCRSHKQIKVFKEIWLVDFELCFATRVDAHACM